MKKRLLLLLFTALSLLSLHAHEFEVDGICYNIISGTSTCYVTYRGPLFINSYSGDVVIPASVTYNGTKYSVTEIGYSAFANCSGLTEVIIPNSVTKIGNDAFRDSSSLTSVTIPNSVTKIGSDAFYECSGLKEVHISDLAAWCKITFSDSSSNPLTYAHHLLLNGEEVKDLIIPNSVTTIGSSAFDGCSGLTSATIPNSVTKIGDRAFWGCSRLTIIIIEDGETTLSLGNNYHTDYGTGKGLFYDCPLETLYLGRSLSYETGKSYGYSPFYSKKSLKEVTIGNSVTSIGASAFRGCSSLTSVNIPNSVTEIGQSAFSGCSSLTSVTIPNSVTEIGDYAFNNTHIAKVFWLANTPPSNYSSVKASVNYVPNDQYTDLSNAVTYQFLNSKFTVDGTVYVPISPTERTCDVVDCDYLLQNGDIEIGDKVTNRGLEFTVLNINDYAFYDCDALTSVIANNNGYIGNSAFYNCDALTSLTANNKGSVGNSAFYNCKQLKEATLGNSITNIGEYAFAKCSSLEHFSVGDQLEAIGVKAFSDCSSLTDFYSYAVEPPVCSAQALDDINKWDCTLYVPAKCSDKYKSASQWESFFFINEMPDPNEEGAIVTIKATENEPIEVYTPGGIKVGNSIEDLPNGIYIVRQGTKTVKVSI